MQLSGMCRVVGDPHRVQQILQNLMGNAIKFSATESKHGEVLATLDTIPKKSGGRLHRFSVTDNGIGISKAGTYTSLPPLAFGF